MGRPLRIDTAATTYHVVNRGVDRATIFADDRDRLEFERLIGLAGERFGVTVDAFCWMSNHYHLVLTCPHGGISRAMHVIGSVYVRHFNERRGRDGPLFRSRFYARPVRSDGYLWRLVRYVHRNPLPITADLSDYRWSSLRVYAEQRRRPPWMNTERVAAIYGGQRSVVDAALGEHRRPTNLDSTEWRDVLHLAAETHFAGAHASRVVRTVGNLVLDQLPPDRTASLESVLVSPTASTKARAAARYRARRRRSESPAFDRAVATALDLAA